MSSQSHLHPQSHRPFPSRAGAHLGRAGDLAGPLLASSQPIMNTIRNDAVKHDRISTDITSTRVPGQSRLTQADKIFASRPRHSAALGSMSIISATANLASPTHLSRSKTIVPSTSQTQDPFGTSGPPARPILDEFFGSQTPPRRRMGTGSMSLPRSQLELTGVEGLGRRTKRTHLPPLDEYLDQKQARFGPHLAKRYESDQQAHHEVAREPARIRAQHRAAKLLFYDGQHGSQGNNQAEQDHSATRTLGGSDIVNRTRLGGPAGRVSLDPRLAMKGYNRKDDAEVTSGPPSIRLEPRREIIERLRRAEPPTQAPAERFIGNELSTGRAPLVVQPQPAGTRAVRASMGAVPAPEHGRPASAMAKTSGVNHLGLPLPPSPRGLSHTRLPLITQSILDLDNRLQMPPAFKSVRVGLPDRSRGSITNFTIRPRSVAASTPVDRILSDTNPTSQGRIADCLGSAEIESETSIRSSSTWATGGRTGSLSTDSSVRRKPASRTTESSGSTSSRFDHQAYRTPQMASIDEDVIMVTRYDHWRMTTRPGSPAAPSQRSTGSCSSTSSSQPRRTVPAFTTGLGVLNKTPQVDTPGTDVLGNWDTPSLAYEFRPIPRRV